MRRIAGLLALAALAMMGCGGPVPSSGGNAPHGAPVILPPLPKDAVTGPEATALARRLLGEVANGVTGARYEVAQPDHPAATALFGRPRASSFPGLCEVRVVRVFGTDWRTAMIASNHLRLGGRAVAAETRFRLLRPHWFGPPGEPDVVRMDADVFSDDQKCAGTYDVARYFRASDAIGAGVAASMFWNVSRLAAKQGQLPFSITCLGQHPACHDPRRILARLTVDDISSIDDRPRCAKGPTAPSVACASVALNRTDHCGNHWVVEMQEINSGSPNADENRPLSVKLDPAPCDRRTVE